MKNLRLRYFAVLREQRGAAEERLLTGAASASEVYEEVRARHGLTMARARVRVAVNDEFAPWDTAVADGDTIAFLPPVAGG
ncbi:MAG TPA: MoaD/ThiS family protein [Opitutaceae bacterium]|jgi:molybdopterin converting factor subunit 1